MSDITLTSEISCTLEGTYGGDRLIAARAWGTAGKNADTASDEEVYRLIRMLMKKRHGSVFEFGCLDFRLHVPLFVIRQWQRHRVGWSYAELSGRWHRVGNPPPLQPVFWVPRANRPLTTGPEHKPTVPQLVAISKQDYTVLLEMLRFSYATGWSAYKNLVTTAGIAAEVARVVLPLATYTTCFAQCNPRSLLHFLSLRIHNEDAAVVSQPQAEIEEAARACETMLKTGWPLVHRAWLECGCVAP